MSSKKKVIAIAITSVALTASSFGVANAASKAKVTRTTVTTVANKAVGAQGRGQELATLLSGLVAKGTITQSQADAVAAAIKTAAEANRPTPPDRAAKDAVITSVLGIDAATLKSRLQAGETLAAIAGSKKQALIDALVAAETTRIDAAVTAGKLTAAQATAKKSELVAHVTAEVESVRGPKGGHKGGPMGAPPTIPAPIGNAA